MATDLAVWLDQTAERMAAAMAPQGTAPFAAKLTEDQKLAYYRAQLFNLDGTPNLEGRNQQLERLGARGFTQVYKAIIQAYPDLRIPPPPGPAEVALAPPPGAPPGPPVGPPPGAGGPAPASLYPPGGGIVPRPMASGGIVTEPTVALIGEAGPEAVVPLYQPPDPDLVARLGSPGPDVTPATPSHDEIVAYIRNAAVQRGIDPNVALAVALHEGTNPRTGRFDSPVQQGTFTTGRSWWPFQLHYGGQGYEQYGNVAGMGNDFTAQTGWQPGDPRAWRDATDFALDRAIAEPQGWALWYGSKPAKVASRQGLPAQRRTA